MIYGVIAFSSTHDAMTAEKTLKAQFPVVVMPTPRSITASCGISLRFDLDNLEVLKSALPQLSGYELYQMDGTDCTPLSIQ